MSGPTRSASTGLPSSSTTSTRMPASAAARARTAVTVVLPTPPLPATIVTRAAESCGTGSTSSGGTFAQTSDRPARGCCLPGRAGSVARRRRGRAGPRAGGAPDRIRARSTCCRSAGCSTRSSSTPSTQAIDRSAADGAQALILQVNTRGAVVGRDDDPGPDGAHRRRPRCPSPSGSARRAPACTGRRPSCSPSPTCQGMAPGARVGHSGIPLRPNGDDGRLRRRRRRPAQRLARPVRRPRPRRLRPTDVRRGHPDDRQHGRRPRRLREGRRHRCTPPSR